MVKLAPRDIEKFIVNIPKNIRAVLLYGADNGLVTTRAKVIGRSRSMVGKFKYEKIKNDTSSLMDDLHSIKLFGEDLSKEKIALVEFSGVSIADPLLSIVKNTSYKGLLIFCAGELGTDSSLRKTFESSVNLAAVPCYLDDQLSLVKVIQQILKDSKISYEAGVLQLLTSCVPIGNRVLIINEVEKILLFLGDKTHILVKDLENYLVIQGEVSFDKLCYQLSLRESDGIDILLSKLQKQGHNLVQIIRMVIYHFNHIHQVKSLIDQKKSQQQAVATLFPPIFFKQQEKFNRSIKLWSKCQLIQMLKDLTDLELSAKQSAATAELLFKQMSISLKLTQ